MEKTETMPRRWSPTESVDFYRGKISECERLVVQIENSMADLPKRLSEKTTDSKHQTGLVVAARKHVYNAMLNTCDIHMTEAKKLIQWIETGKQPT